MPNLRIPVHGDLPDLCMTCGGGDTHVILREFKVEGILVPGDRLLRPIPICWSCCRAWQTQRWCRRLFWIVFLPALCACFVGVMEASLLKTLAPWLIPLLLIGLGLRASHRVALPCLALGSHHLLLKVRCRAFVEAFRASLPPEEPAARVERMLCEGYSRAETSRALEEVGMSTRDACQLVARSVSRRKSHFRKQGLRQMALGLVLLLPMAIVAIAVPGGPLALPWALHPLLMGAKLVLTGSGQQL